jgi:hypothetical protein
MTGVGKSTFIEYFANDGNAPKIGRTLESCKHSTRPPPEHDLADMF